MPEKDPRLSVERYKRSYEQDEELGLNDIKTENYQEQSGENPQVALQSKPPPRTVQVKPVLRNSEHHHPLATPPPGHVGVPRKYLQFDSRPTIYSSSQDNDAGSSTGGFTTSDSEAEGEARMLVTANLLELGRSGRYLITRQALFLNAFSGDFR